ncbi:MAG: tetratricopeptide repeat protein [Rhodanobacter sp.]
MAFEAYDDYEQNERVQKWLRVNGIPVVVGLIIGLVAIFGWQRWRAHQESNQSAAAQLYQQIQVAAASGNSTLATQNTEQLMKDYPKSAYAVFAVSDRAVQEVQAKQLDKARVSLQWASDHAKEKTLKSLVQLRMARVELAQNDAAKALTVLDAIPKDSYQGLVLELRGDALVKLGRTEDARKAYQTALSTLSEAAPQRGALQMKFDDLAVAGKQGA